VSICLTLTPGEMDPARREHAVHHAENCTKKPMIEILLTESIGLKQIVPEKNHKEGGLPSFLKEYIKVCHGMYVDFPS
jgi:hypothetical protein